MGGPGRRRRGRCRLLARGWPVLGALLLLAGCTPPGLPAPISPSAQTARPNSPAAAATVIVGVDGTVAGFNPHAIADYSPAAAAVVSLVLPSVSKVATDGSLRLDTGVVLSAVVTSGDPFTVTYTLNRKAAWSDGTPITAEDFSYLRDRMIAEAGTVDPAGYRLITAIRSRDAGKTVDVEFADPFAQWLTLFSPLLPAHILKDSPGGWAAGLATGLPVSGNRYKMDAYDSVTGEITLVRNDKYWGAQPGRGAAIIRLGSAGALIDALAHGDLQAVFVRPGAAAQRALEAAVPAGSRVAVGLPGTVQLVFNTTAGPTAEIAVRRAIAAGIDLPALRSALGGGNPAGVQQVPSLVALPDPSVAPGSPPTGSPPTGSPPTGSPPTGSQPTGPPGGTPGGAPRGDPGTDRTAALAQLAAAGYRRVSVYARRGGTVLRLTLVYPTADPRLAAAARLIQSQLAGVGIEVDLIRDTPTSVVAGRLAAGTADLGLLMVPRGASDAVAAASAFECAQSPADPAVKPPLRTGNLSGFCAANAPDLLRQELAGGSVGPAVETRLGAELPVVALARPTATFATTPGLSSVVRGAGPGWVFTGPFAGLARWPVG